MLRNKTAIRRVRRPVRPALQLESLEPRQVLTVLGGNVVAQLTGGTLRLTGDALPNQFVVASVTGGKMAVIGLPGTTVNGSAATFVTTKPVTNIVANLGAGNDVVGFSNSAQALSDLPNDIVPDGSVAALQSAIDTVAGGQQKFVLPGSLTLAAGAGDDALGLVGDVRGSVVANLGASSHDVGNSFGIGNNSGSANPLLDSSVGGSISVEGSQQKDLVGLTRTTVAGSVALALGAGLNSTFVGAATIRGGLAASGVGGDDAVQFFASSIAGAVTAALGNGVNYFTVLNGSSVGAVSVATGSGIDTVAVVGATVRNDINIASGGGDDNVQVSFTTTGGSVEATTGEGADTVALANSTVGANTVISTLGGNDTVNLIGSTVRYALTVDLGAGNDSLGIATTQALAAYLYGGPGTNSLSIDAASQTGIRRIYRYQFQTVS